MPWIDFMTFVCRSFYNRKRHTQNASKNSRHFNSIKIESDIIHNKKDETIKSFGI